MSHFHNHHGTHTKEKPIRKNISQILSCSVTDINRNTQRHRPQVSALLTGPHGHIRSWPFIVASQQWHIIFNTNHLESESCSVASNSLRPHGVYSPWNSPGKNTGVDSHSLLQGIFSTQGSNPGLPHCREILYQLSHQGSPMLAFIQPLFILPIQPTDLCFPSVSGLIALWKWLLSS